MDRHTLLLFAGIGALLLLASLIGFLLKRRAGGPSPTIDNLNARIHALVLKLMQAAGPPAIFGLLEAGLRADFGAERVAIQVFAETTAIDHSELGQFVGRERGALGRIIVGTFEQALPVREVFAVEKCGVTFWRRVELFFGGRQ